MRERDYWNLVGENNFLGQPIAGTTAAIPDSIQIAAGHLVWSPAGRFKRLKNPEAVLDAFVELAVDDQPEAILSFAKRFGPLWLCERHNIVAWHRPVFQFRNGLGPAPAAGDEEVNLSSLTCAPGRIPGHFHEPLASWRALALRTRNLLLVTAQLRDGETPPQAAWADVDGFAESFKYMGAWARLEDPWNRLAENLNWFLEAAEVASFVESECASLSLVLRNRFIPSPLAIVALQLVLAATRAQGLFTCAGCGAPYPARRPRGKEKRTYCSTCQRNKIPQRDAARAWRRRKRDQQNKRDQQKESVE
jgi:hypothetical protein